MVLPPPLVAHGPQGD